MTKGATESPAVCFVTADFPGIIRNGGIGTHFLLISRALAARGWSVTVLFCGEAEDEARLLDVPDELAQHGVSFKTVDEFPQPPGDGLPHFGGGHTSLEMSERVLAALEALQADIRFDLIEFPDWFAVGMRPIQAKVAGDALLDTRLAVKLHSPSQWQREGNLETISTPQELTIDFCEQYAFEHADIQLSPSNYMLDYVREAGWKVGSPWVAYPYPDCEVSVRQVPEVRELVFFGRLERRKGLHLFLDALDEIDPEIPVLFMGKDTDLDGRRATDVIAKRLADRPHRIETDLDRSAALAMFESGDRLAVIPSLRETFGFTAAECIANRIPFVAARAGGIPEVLDHPPARERWLFDPTVTGLAEKLSDRLRADGEQEVRLRTEVAETCSPTRWNDQVDEVYRDLITDPIKAVSRVSETATVTVAIPHFNHERFLPEALSSIASQTRPPDEVFVVDDGSTSDAALGVFAEQEALYPDWTFERSENRGPGAVRNRCLEVAKGTYFLPFDSDNIATPQLIERLLAAMERNPSRAATTCHNLAFASTPEIEKEKFIFRYAPTGGPLISACLDNVYGDTCALFRVEMLKSVGGFEVHTWSPHEDWETFVKLAVKELEVGVLPQPLFYYRTDVGGRLQDLSTDPAMTYRHRRHMIEGFFANAKLSMPEMLDLWECVIALSKKSYEGVAKELQEQHMWHETQMRELHEWSDARVKELDAFRRSEVAQQVARAKAAEHRLATNPIERFRPAAIRARNAMRRVAAQVGSNSKRSAGL